MIRARRVLGGLSLLAIAAAAGNASAQASPVGGTFTSYIALGDSYSSGVGTTEFNEKDLCLKSSTAWPYRLEAALGNPGFVHAACSGAITSDVVAQGPKWEAQGNMSQIALLPPADQLDGALITVQVGGNDLGLGEPLVECFQGIKLLDDTRGEVPEGCATLQDMYNRATDVIRDLATSLDYLYKGLRDVAPNATIVAIGYPHLVSTTDPGCGATATGAALPLDARQKFNALVDAGNAQIKASAANAGISAITDEVVAAFDKHEACSASEWIVTPETSGVDVMNLKATKKYGVRVGHPNDLGHRAIADAVLSALPSVATRNGTVTPPPVDEEEQGGEVSTPGESGGDESGGDDEP